MRLVTLTYLFVSLLLVSSCAHFKKDAAPKSEAVKVEQEAEEAVVAEPLVIVTEHTVAAGENLQRISRKKEIYGDSRLWWVLAWFNQKPTEAHFKVGDVYYVPDSPAEIIRFFKKQNGDF